MAQVWPMALPQRCPPWEPSGSPFGNGASALFRVSIERLRCQLQRKNTDCLLVMLASPLMVNWSSKLLLGAPKRYPQVFRRSPISQLFDGGANASKDLKLGSMPLP